MFRLVRRQAFKPVGIHRRAIGSTKRRSNDDDSHHDDSTSTADGAAGFQSGGPSPFVTWERFGQQQTTVAVMSSTLDQFDAGQRELKAEMNKKFDKVDARFNKLETKMDGKFDGMGAKMDRMLYAIVGGIATFLLKGGFDSYIIYNKR